MVNLNILFFKSLKTYKMENNLSIYKILKTKIKNLINIKSPFENLIKTKKIKFFFKSNKNVKNTKFIHLKLNENIKNRKFSSSNSEKLYRQNFFRCFSNQNCEIQTFFLYINPLKMNHFNFEIVSNKLLSIYYLYIKIKILTFKD